MYKDSDVDFGFCHFECVTANCNTNFFQAAFANGSVKELKFDCKKCTIRYAVKFVFKPEKQKWEVSEFQLVLSDDSFKFNCRSCHENLVSPEYINNIPELKLKFDCEKCTIRYAVKFVFKPEKQKWEISGFQAATCPNTTAKIPTLPSPSIAGSTPHTVATPKPLPTDPLHENLRQRVAPRIQQWGNSVPQPEQNPRVFRPVSPTTSNAPTQARIPEATSLQPTGIPVKMIGRDLKEWLISEFDKPLSSKWAEEQAELEKERESKTGCKISRDDFGEKIVQLQVRNYNDWTRQYEYKWEEIYDTITYLSFQETTQVTNYVVNSSKCKEKTVWEIKNTTKSVKQTTHPPSLRK